MENKGDQSEQSVNRALRRRKLIRLEDDDGYRSLTEKAWARWNQLTEEEQARELGQLKAITQAQPPSYLVENGPATPDDLGPYQRGE